MLQGESTQPSIINSFAQSEHLQVKLTAAPPWSLWTNPLPVKKPANDPQRELLFNSVLLEWVRLCKCKSERALMVASRCRKKCVFWCFSSRKLFFFSTFRERKVKSYCFCCYLQRKSPYEPWRVRRNEKPQKRAGKLSKNILRCCHVFMFNKVGFSAVLLPSLHPPATTPVCVQCPNYKIRTLLIALPSKTFKNITKLFILNVVEHADLYVLLQ